MGVVVGHDVADVAASAGTFGVSDVYVVDAPEFEAPLPQPRVDALEAVVAASGAENVLFAASVLSADVAAGLSARLDAGVNWDVTDFRIDGGALVGHASRTRRLGARRRGLDEFAADRHRALGVVRADRDRRVPRRSTRSR